MDDGAQTGGSLRAGAEFTTSSPRGFTIVGIQGIGIEKHVQFPRGYSILTTSTKECSISFHC